MPCPCRGATELPLDAVGEAFVVRAFSCQPWSRLRSILGSWSLHKSWQTLFSEHDPISFRLGGTADHGKLGA